MSEDTLDNLWRRVFALEKRVAALEPPAPELIPLDKYPSTTTEESHEALTKNSI
jgi:hypothetical protein